MHQAIHEPYIVRIWETPQEWKILSAHANDLGCSISTQVVTRNHQWLPCKRGNFLRTSKMGLLVDPSIWSRDTQSYRLIAALFTIAQKRNKLGRAPTHEWEEEIRNLPCTFVPISIKYFVVALTKQGKICMTRTSSVWRKKLTKISEDEKIFHAHGLKGST